MYALYVQINTYLFAVIACADLEPVQKVWDCASTGSEASGLGDKAPEAGEYITNKYKI